MKTYLLPIPSKKTEDVNWLQPLNKYLTAVYGNTSEFSQDLGTFDKLRSDLKGVNGDSTGMKLYFKYYSQLELLDLRIPFNQINSKKINFVWYDAFHKTTNHKQHSLPFEKANVLFNIGSILTRVGCHKYEEAQGSSEGADEGVKEALQLFQQAAGVFEFVGENFLHAPSDDLTQSTLSFLKKLCLAQSQEVFVLKVITGDLDQTKNSLIAKLCVSTSNHYAECEKMIDNSANSRESLSTSDFDITGDEDEELESIVEEESKSSNKITVKLDPLWTAMIHFKNTYYKSLSYHFNGLHLESTRKYGDAIAYFTKSQNVLNEISSLTLKSISKAGVNDAFEVLDNYKYHKDAVAIKLADLEKDNDLVYHEIVPSLVTLPEIKPLDSAKVIPMSQISLFNEINDSNYGNFLKNVVPIDTHELLSYYSEEKSQFLRNELDMVDVSNEELASVLEYLKMPKAIVNLKEIVTSNDTNKSTNGTSEVDPETIGKASEVHSNYALDTSNKARILETRKQIYGVILDIEGKNNMDPSFRDDIVKLKKSLYDATASDDKLFGLVTVENSELYSILGKGPSSKEFKNLFETNAKSSPDTEISLLDIVDAPTTANSNLLVKIKKIEDILYDLNVIKANKQKLVDNLKSEIHNDDISDIIILNSKIKSTNEIKTVIFPEELKKFDPYTKELDKLIENQKKFIDSLKEEWDSLVSNPQIRDIQSSKTFKDTLMRDQTSRINEFYENWKKYSVGLKRGKDFYGQLMNFATSMRDSVRQNEGLNDRFSGINLSAQSTGYQQQQQPQQPPHPQPQPPPSYHSTPSYQKSPSYQHPQSQPPQATQQYQPPVPQQNSYQNYQNYQPMQHQPSYSQPPHQPSYSQPPRQPSYSSTQYSQFPQPMLDRTPSTQFGSHSQPPPNLPPKQPSYQPLHPPQPPQQPSNPQSPFPQGQYPQNGSQSSLIYDQPSTYNPDMYNFFSKN